MTVSQEAIDAVRGCADALQASTSVVPVSWIPGINFCVDVLRQAIRKMTKELDESL